MRLTTEREHKSIIPLIDPDKWEMNNKLSNLIKAINNLDIEFILVGSSQPLKTDLEAFISYLKKDTKIPIVLFPSSHRTLASNCNGILFLSLLNSRDPKYLIENHIKSAKFIKNSGMDIYSTAYILFGDKKSSVAVHSNTEPLTYGNREEIESYILAAEYLGMENIYLEAGSGSETHISLDTIKVARKTTNLPIVCGGGIKNYSSVKSIFNSGANYIVIGNLLEEDGGTEKFREIVRQIKREN
ncbi:MAG: phosphoglycerol geranylgeranyltransferase [Candidatus Cloacimonadota bacterium]|nr:MAG: phosphoglycerol geranylgeranyltransferase [Candidatus Cloacimonadota bacterium]PIE77634.1 MAG: phosphoglycerol geranylgeranyltransferase [Candidatus Delongbacteria bacterium]